MTDDCYDHGFLILIGSLAVFLDEHASQTLYRDWSWCLDWK